MHRHCIVICFVTLYMARAHHAGHHIIPVPFPYSAGSYKHTSSVVNVPIYQERLIIIKKPGNHHHHHGHSHGHKHGHAHKHGHQHGHEHMYRHGNIHGYNGQESRTPQAFNEILPFANHPNMAQSEQYPYFEDLSFLLHPKILEQSVWIDQYPDIF